MPMGAVGSHALHLTQLCTSSRYPSAGAVCPVMRYQHRGLQHSLAMAAVALRGLQCSSCSPGSTEQYGELGEPGLTAEGCNQALALPDLCLGDAAGSDLSDVQKCCTSLLGSQLLSQGRRGQRSASTWGLCCTLQRPQPCRQPQGQENSPRDSHGV